MYERTIRFAKKFPKQYKVIKELPPSMGGPSMASVSVQPNLIFEILDVVFGPYDDLLKDFKWIDDKVTWHWFFDTGKGILCVYDWKGAGTRIVCIGKETSEIKKEAEEFKDVLEKSAAVYPKVRKRDLCDELKQDPLRSFRRTFLATDSLLAEARRNGSLLEGLVLYATTIDAHLRYGIILTRQLQNETSEYDVSFVFQKGKTYLSETTIHQRALSAGFISRKQFNELSKLYEFRNKAVHRYFISDFEYKDLPKYLERYENIREAVAEKIIKLEHRQVKRKVGMIKAEDIVADTLTTRKAVLQKYLKINSDLVIAVIPKRNHMFPREFGPRDDVKEIEE